jgi:hypothetical protein
MAGDRLRARRAAWLGAAAVVAWHVVALAIVGVGVFLTADAIAQGDHLSAGDLLPAAVAALVLLTLRPHGHDFAKPGPRLLRGEQPELFKLLDEATDAVRLPAFDEVYVDVSPHVSVVQRTGAFGQHDSFALVLGSALLQALSPGELSALVASEAAQMQMGDRFETFVERTRVRLRRGLGELPEAGVGLTNIPFALYSRYFLKTTAPLSREHTLQTDDLVAQEIGARRLMEGLSAADLLPAAFRAWRDLPDRGQRPPTFVEFKNSDAARQAMEFARFRSADESPDPGLGVSVRERVARLAEAGDQGQSLSGRSASAVVENFDTLERQLQRDELASR